MVEEWRPTQRRSCLIVVSKLPRPGRVKTRLAAAIGDTEAAALSEAFLIDTLATAATLPDVDVMLSFTPATGRPYYQALAPETILLAQPGGDLGRRLSHAFAHAFARRYEAVVIVGADSPHLAADSLRQAFGAVSDRTVVIGPAEDGGYYLLGLGRPVPELFREIDWSTDRVLSQTLRRAEDAGLDVISLTPYYDVDTATDLERVRHDMQPGSATARALAALL